MAQQLSVCTVLLEDRSSLPSTHVGHLTLAYNSRYREYSALSWLLWVLHTHGVRNHTETHCVGGPSVYVLLLLVE